MWDLKDCNLISVGTEKPGTKLQAEGKNAEGNIYHLKIARFSAPSLLPAIKSPLNNAILPINTIIVIFSNFICPWIQVAHIIKRMWMRKRLYFTLNALLSNWGSVLFFKAQQNDHMVHNNVTDHQLGALKGANLYNEREKNVPSNLLLSFKDVICSSWKRKKKQTHHKCVKWYFHIICNPRNLFNNS